jgi:hypothetical protein
MYPNKTQNWMIGVGALALVALLAQTWREYRYLDQKPNPYPHTPGLPTIQEDPFDPTSAYMDLGRLPWVLDPVSAWPEELRQRAQGPCGAVEALRARYPLWDKGQGCDALEDGEALVLERGEGWALALEPRGAGLWMRSVPR